MMSFKELAISMQSDMINQAKAQDMTEIRNDAIYEEEREHRAGVTDWTEDRHDSDAEGHRQEAAELRDYSFLRDGND